MEGRPHRAREVRVLVIPTRREPAIFPARYMCPIPGERRGGRQRGTLNKKTVLRNAAITAAAVHSNLSPHAAYEVSPEAEARSRIVVLGLRCWKNRGSAAEQSELDELKARYPDLPIDPDDVHLIRTLKAYDEALKRYREMSTESGQGLKRRQGER
jgi:hypothetical protein